MTSMDKPLDLAGRRARREEIRKRFLDEAELLASRSERSAKCGGILGEHRHFSDNNGCQNNGSGCLCECHDPKE